MRVLGIDPGSRALGYGIVESDGSRFRRIASGVIRPSAAAPRPARLHEILRDVRRVLAEHRLEAVAVEDAFFGAGPRSCLRLGEARGVVLALSAEVGLPVHEYPPATVKKTLTGAGAAGKDRVARCVRAVLAMRGNSRPPDETDALAVALCHLLRSEGATGAVGAGGAAGARGRKGARGTAGARGSADRAALLARTVRSRRRGSSRESRGGRRGAGRAAARRVRSRVVVDARPRASERGR